MRRSGIKRGESTLRRTPFKSAFVRHSPFLPQNGLKRKVAGQGGTGGENAPGAATDSKRASLRLVGKKGREWVTARAWLRRHFNYAGITRCEFRFQGCWGDASGGFAHCKKRRKLEEGEIWHVGVACFKCHQRLDEVMSHDEMHMAVHAVIDKRGLIAPQV